MELLFFRSLFVIFAMCLCLAIAGVFPNKGAERIVLPNKYSNMSDASEEKLLKVFSGTLWQAELVKGLLDTNAVPCAIMDETIGAVTSSYAPHGGEVYIIVNEENEKRAKEIIESNTIPDAEGNVE